MSEPTAALDRPWQRQHLRAPHGDESVLAVPPLIDAADLAGRNCELLRQSAINLQGRDLQHLRRWAREKVCRAAREYVAGWCNAPPVANPAELLFVSGHQPTLFHPGVWVKNFAVGQLARNAGTTGLNLVVDNDTLATSSIRVPRGNRDEPRIEIVPFDEPRPAQPWEEARILNAGTFGSFAERVAQIMGEWGIQPLVVDLWPDAVRHAEKSNVLADCLTATRNQCERRWGTANLELPLSRLCRLEPFLWFAAHLLAHLPRLHRIYNEVLREYRVVNRVRSRTHPVPDLREVAGWLEAPFWMWRNGDLRRKRVLARQVEREVWLSDGDTVFAKLPLTPQGDACCAVKVLQSLPEQGIRFRTRALTTTLFARLCLADLFVHGIGGAKYDEMTDRIIGRFFGLPAPGFLALSATVQLPLHPHPVQHADEVRLKAMLRELDYNSDRHLDTSGVDFPSARPGQVENLPHGIRLQALTAEKQRLIAEHQAVRRHSDSAGTEAVSKRSLISPSRANFTKKLDSESQATGFCNSFTGGEIRPVGRRSGYERHRRLQEINRQLAAATVGERRRIEEDLSRTVQQLEANSLLQGREYSYCLHPAEKVQRFMDRVCHLG